MRTIKSATETPYKVRMRESVPKTKTKQQQNLLVKSEKVGDEDKVRTRKSEKTTARTNT